MRPFFPSTLELLKGFYLDKDVDIIRKEGLKGIKQNYEI